MSEIRKYVIVNADNSEDDFEYDDPNEAIERATKRGRTAVSARIYTFDDSELVWTSTGDSTWPPAPATATCKHCGRNITTENGAWVDPEATGDDAVWRETCDSHDTFTAEHEPEGTSK